MDKLLSEFALLFGSKNGNELFTSIIATKDNFMLMEFLRFSIRKLFKIYGASDGIDQQGYLNILARNLLSYAMILHTRSADADELSYVIYLCRKELIRKPISGMCEINRVNRVSIKASLSIPLLTTIFTSYYNTTNLHDGISSYALALILIL